MKRFALAVLYTVLFFSFFLFVIKILTEIEKYDETTNPLLILIVLFLIVLSILWFLLPFAVFGIKGKLDNLIENTSDTNQKLDLLLAEISESNNLLQESISNLLNNNNKINQKLDLILEKIKESADNSSPIEPEQTKPETKVCSKCNIPMQVKTVTKGEQQGKQFYVCSNYPTCREMYKFET